MAKIKIYVILIVIVLTGLYAGSIFAIKDQYDNQLYKLTKENEEIKIKNKRLKNDTAQMGATIDSLYDELEEKRALECDCGWYMDFYYDNAERFGAYE